MIKKTTLTLVFSFLLLYSFAQNSKFNLGLGIGRDYGGIGSKLTILPTPNLGLFAGLGYAIVGPGVNAGLIFRILPDKSVCPYLTAMYGYNSVIKITGDISFEETYYGPTFGGGLEFKGRRSDNFFNLEIVVPIYSESYNDKMTELKNNPFIKFESVPPPIGMSLGYHFAF